MTHIVSSQEQRGCSSLSLGTGFVWLLLRGPLSKWSPQLLCVILTTEWWLILKTQPHGRIRSTVHYVSWFIYLITSTMVDLKFTNFMPTGSKYPYGFEYWFWWGNQSQSSCPWSLPRRPCYGSGAWSSRPMPHKEIRMRCQGEILVYFSFRGLAQNVLSGNISHTRELWCRGELGAEAEPPRS